jgi:hypothetical protein
MQTKGRGLHSNSTPADLLLPRLDKVQETAPGQWIACCPAHDDRSPSLSIRQTDDRLLIYCHAACPASDVTAAVGLTLADLFDRPLEHQRRPMRQRERQRHGQAAEALRAIRHESLIVLVAAHRLAGGYGIDGDDLERLHTAHQRILATTNVNLPRPDHPLPSDSFLPATRDDLDRDRAAAERVEVRP